MVLAKCILKKHLLKLGRSANLWPELSELSCDFSVILTHELTPIVSFEARLVTANPELSSKYCHV